MTQRFFACLRFAAPILLLACCAGSPAFAQDKTRADELSDQGDYFFKAGYYFRAADNYRLALLEDPTSPWKKLAFGHSLFATGQYGYASYAQGFGTLGAKKGFITLAPQGLGAEVRPTGGAGASLLGGGGGRESLLLLRLPRVRLSPITTTHRPGP